MPQRVRLKPEDDVHRPKSICAFTAMEALAISKSKNGPPVQSRAKKLMVVLVLNRSSRLDGLRHHPDR